MGFPAHHSTTVNLLTKGAETDNEFYLSCHSVLLTWYVKMTRHMEGVMSFSEAGSNLEQRHMNAQMIATHTNQTAAAKVDARIPQVLLQPDFGRGSLATLLAAISAAASVDRALHEDLPF